MKKYIKLLCTLLMGGALTSCEAFLEVNPNNGVDSEDVYSEYENFSKALDFATQMVHDYFIDNHDNSGCEIGAFSDETQMLKIDRGIATLGNQGLWLDASISDFGFGDSEMAGEAVDAIRIVNLCFDNYDKLVSFPDPEKAPYTEEEYRGQLLGQMYFLRGFHYFQIIKRYGPMPNMQETFSLDHNFVQERPTYQECTDWLVEDFDNAIENLPEKWSYSQDIGRPTKTSARAFKAMALLYASSPLMNGDHQTFGAAKGVYNIDRAKEAATAALEAIINAESDATRYVWYEWIDGSNADTYNEYKNNFTPKTNYFSDEAIYQSPSSRAKSGEFLNVGAGWYNESFMGGAYAGTQQPTHNAVKWFETKNGYAWEDRYDDPDFDDSDPYANRDPRLHFNVFCHGDNLCYGNEATVNVPFDVKRDGRHREEFEKQELFTGYMHKKYRWPKMYKSVKDENGKQYTGTATTHGRIVPFIRMPQLYLDFAEAANEAYGPTGEVTASITINGEKCTMTLNAYDAIAKVRARFDMPAVREEYSTTTADFRERIYNERAVELFHEFHRWFDIRRWKIAEELFAESNSCIKAVDIYDEDGDGDLEYNEVTLDGAVRVFEKKHYWYPFSTTDMNKLGYDVFTQNPGW
ncbi:MAG: RagB/SusD family nutrient uptake outer membrane protein [Rikenellaceae bacterium]